MTLQDISQSNTDYYLDNLKNNICFVQFEKKDGTLRGMRCTLRAEMLPEQTDLEEHIQLKVSTEVIAVQFEKKDGTIRALNCTLRAEMLPEQTDPEEHVQRKVSTEVIAVWDLEEKGWRSFRKSSVIEFKILPETI